MGNKIPEKENEFDFTTDCKDDSSVDLERLVLIIEKGEDTEEFVFFNGNWYSAEEYLRLMGYELNAWREM